MFPIFPINALFAKAKQFTEDNRPSSVEVTHLTRDQPSETFDHILSKEHGIMEPRMKDSVFAMPDASFFGNRRVKVPINDLFSRRYVLYFADFYCTPRAHYLTLVLAPVESAENEFCDKHLLPLNLLSNPWFKVETFTGVFKRDSLFNVAGVNMDGPRDYGETIKATATQVSGRKLNLELFVCSEVDISKYQITPITPLGKGRATGIFRNNASCTDCNVDNIDHPISITDNVVYTERKRAASPPSSPESDNKRIKLVEDVEQAPSDCPITDADTKSEKLLFDCYHSKNIICERILCADGCSCFEKEASIFVDINAVMESLLDKVEMNS